MRITKHRGKREDNGEWVYGAFYPIKDEDVFFIINNCKSIDFDDKDTTFNGYKVHKKSVGEFTGLHDKNGKEIYEGDILIRHKKNGFYDKKYIVAFERFGFTNLEHLTEKEVIGNVFENPDFVKL